jgi:hypothetical protein
MNLKSSVRLSIVFYTIIALAGCSQPSPRMAIVNIALHNSSSNRLDWVELKWAGPGPEVPGGILVVGANAETLDAEWPNVPSAKLRIVDDKTRQTYNVEVSLVSMNERIRSGTCHDVTFDILSYTNVNVICQ